jgi:hypothetical protein
MNLQPKPAATATLPDPEDFRVLRQIAKIVGSTNQGLGQHLLQHGLRNQDGSPTEKATLDQWAIAYRLDFGGFGWKWDVEKVVEFCKTHPAPSKGKRRRG